MTTSDGPNGTEKPRFDGTRTALVRSIFRLLEFRFCVCFISFFSLRFFFGDRVCVFFFCFFAFEIVSCRVVSCRLPCRCVAVVVPFGV